MKIKLKLLLGCTTLGILCAEELQTTTDDVLAMLQSSLRVKENNNDTDQNDDFSLGAPDMSSINKLEELVMARVRDDKVWRQQSDQDTQRKHKDILFEHYCHDCSQPEANHHEHKSV